ncbi:MAG: tRNA-dihydrouridine synthase, partial [Terracidiphilus sp.]
DRYNMIRAYFEMLLAEEIATRDLPRDGRMGDPVGKMKQFATWFTHGVPGGAKLRAAIYHAHTGNGVLAEVERFFMARIEAGELAEPELDSIVENEPAGLADAVLVCD